MNIINKSLFEQLSQVSGICLSMYMPTHQTGHAVMERQDATQLKNHLKQARTLLKDLEWDEKKIDKFLEKAENLLEDDEFWKHQQHELAILVHETNTYVLQSSMTFTHQTLLSSEFYLTPLIPLLNRSYFFVLALSQKQPRLYKVFKSTIEPVENQKLFSSNFAQVMELYDFEKSLQFHSGQGENATPMFHGHGANDNNKRDDYLKEYPRLLDAEIPHEDRTIHTPLILAGLEHMVALFKEITDYPHIIEDYIHKNADELDDQEIHAQALEISESLQDTTQQNEILSELIAKKQASSNIQQIIKEVGTGRVNELYLLKDAYRWGKVKSKEDAFPKAEFHEEYQLLDTDILNWIAVQTIAHGGKVNILPTEELPESIKDQNIEALATFRW